MKGKRKTQKGITLIALIITIVILLILAMVSIRLVINQGILDKAKYGVDKYKEEETAEQEKLAQIEEEMEKYGEIYNGSYTDYILEKKYNGMKIGDKIDYTEGIVDSRELGMTITEDLTWRVLGINEKEQIELISENPMVSNPLVDAAAFSSGFIKGVFSKIGSGKGAVGGRNLKAEDINKLGNYDPSTYDEYGRIYSFRFPLEGNYLQVKERSSDGSLLSDWKDVQNGYQYMKFKDGRVIDSNHRSDEGIDVTASYYTYKISDYVKQITSDGKKMSDIITNGTNGSSSIEQILDNSEVTRCWSNQNVCVVSFFKIGNQGTFESYAEFNSITGNSASSVSKIKARPVVTLSSDVKLSGSSESGWTIE